ncbi:hypothetical protein QBC37DRAFT_35843 [Rhypophila decipiens]|uniref:Ankyrin repeat protein n=1 Tax=Rhypophila decipiens TaxID=261697 RepID=A0AAN6Y0I3_9PEZI|nr:hypothetical protein QBC37DRAFT_35843 [Rhypophila decipiens]
MTTHPLYYASSFGYGGLVEVMLKYDKSAIANIDAPGGRAGSTALLIACFRCHLEAATLLVETGANPITLDGTFVRIMAEDDEAMYGLPSLWWPVENGPECDCLARQMVELWAPPGLGVQEVLKDIVGERTVSLRSAYGKGKQETDEDELADDDHLYEEIHDGTRIHHIPISGVSIRGGPPKNWEDQPPEISWQMATRPQPYGFRTPSLHRAPESVL